MDRYLCRRQICIVLRGSSFITARKFLQEMFICIKRGKSIHSVISIRGIIISQSFR